jgi:hypothetical protein
LDATWFVGLLQTRERRPGAEVPAPTPTPGGRQHWGEAPALDQFLGRAREWSTLRKWVLDDACRVVALLGLPGTGKTLLAARVARDVAPYFEHVYWRNLRNGLPFGEWLATAIELLSPRDATLLESQATQLDRMVELLREAPSLLILDSFEAVFSPAIGTGATYPVPRRMASCCGSRARRRCRGGCNSRPRLRRNSRIAHVR